MVAHSVRCIVKAFHPRGLCGTFPMVHGRFIPAKSVATYPWWHILQCILGCIFFAVHPWGSTSSRQYILVVQFPQYVLHCTILCGTSSMARYLRCICGVTHHIGGVPIACEAFSYNASGCKPWGENLLSLRCVLHSGSRLCTLASAQSALLIGSWAT